MRERGTAGPAGNAVGRGTMNSRFEAVIHPKRSVMFTVKRGRRADTRQMTESAPLRTSAPGNCTACGEPPAKPHLDSEQIVSVTEIIEELAAQCCNGDTFARHRTYLR
jgi:hypothetical protein